MAIYLIFALAALLGIVMQFAVKRFRGELVGDLFDYLVLTHPQHTLAALSATGAAVAAVAASGQLDQASLVYVIASGVTTGYAFDSAINRGAQQ